MKDIEIKQAVRENYARAATGNESCCDTSSSGCCNGSTSAREYSKLAGYTDEEMDSVPDGANLGLGCGNPVALASLKEGETVVDLGSGAGFDAFLAAARVGKEGRVIGVDMTPEMIAKARQNAEKSSYSNVEFRLGEIENLPLPDAAADIIISNCVINLAPDKHRVFSEAFRVLKPGGRIMVSDIVLKSPLPEAVLESVSAYVGCIAGASLMQDYFDAIESAGFTELRVLDEAVFGLESIENDPSGQRLVESLGIPREEAVETAKGIVSVKVSAVKPG